MPVNEATPLLASRDAEDARLGMRDCLCFPVRPLGFAGFDTVDLITRPAATAAINYVFLYILDSANDSCLRAARIMWYTLGFSHEIFGLAAVWYNVDSTFPPTWSLFAGVVAIGGPGVHTAS